MQEPQEMIPGLSRSPGGGHGNSLQYSCLENPMFRGSWWAVVHRVTKTQTGLKQLSNAHLMGHPPQSSQMFFSALTPCLEPLLSLI